MPGAANMPSTSAAGDVVLGNQPRKKNKGMVIGMAVLAVLAAGGIGFGVWAVLDKNQESANLNNQIADLNSQLAEQQAVAEVDEGTTADIDADSSKSTSEYIYVGEWGIKIKIPENLGNISYIVNNWDEDNFAGTSLCVQGATTGHDNQKPSFIKMNAEGAYVCLGKNTKSISVADGGAGNQTFEVGEYYVTGPQALAGDGTDQDWEIESVNAIKAMLSEENITEI